MRLSKGNLSFQASSDDEPLIKSVNPSKSQNKRKREDDDRDDGGDEENKMLGKTKRSRLEESSAGILCSTCGVCPCFISSLDVARVTL